MLRDLRYCLRTLLKTPGLAAVAVLSLGLGIGLNLTVFGVFESVFLRGVTASDPSHTFHAWAGGSNRISYPNYRDLRDSRAVSIAAAYSLMQFSVGNGESREKIFGQAVAGDYFEMLGVRPFLGRGFTAEEKAPEAGAHVALLSYPFWKQRFGASREVLGQNLRLNGEPFTVIGVLPDGYRSLHGFASEPPFYVPYSVAVDPAFRDREGHPLELVVRTAASQSRAQATAALLATAKELERIYPAENRNFGQMRVFGLSAFDQLDHGGAQRGVLFFGILGAVVGMILLIACANVAGLLVARAVNRRREVAIRLAIGGSSTRLIRLFLTEGLLLSIAGVAAATLVYLWAARFMEHLQIPSEVPFYLHPELNWRMALYSIAVALTAALLSSFAPAMEASRANVLAALKNGLDPAGRGRLFSLRNSLVIAQVAGSLVLLVISLLFVRSLRDVQTVDPGFNVQNQLLASIRFDTLPKGQNTADLAQTAMDRLAQMPGVRSVSDAFLVPLSRSTWMTRVEIGNDRHEQPVVQANAVGSRYFGTMGIRVAAGREFEERDTKSAPQVAIVNQAFANRFFSASSPLGQIVTVGGPKGRGRESWQIVGIVADSKHESLGEGPTPVVYRPLKQEDFPMPPTIHVRTAAPAAVAAPAVRSALRAAFPDALVEVKTMDENITSSTLPNKIGAALLGGMGALGLVLASVGLYGVLAYAVSRRAREIGVRMALGASPLQVLRIVLGQAMTLVGTGVAAGLALSFLATKPLASFLSAGVSVSDPTTLAVVVVVLGVTALAASALPAIRALRVDPIRALRCD